MFNPLPIANRRANGGQQNGVYVANEFSFPFQCIALKLVGAWPMESEDSNTFNKLYLLWSRFIIIIIFLTCYAQISYIVNSWGDLLNLTECGCTVFMGMHNLIRLIHLSFMRDEMKGLIENFVSNIWISRVNHREIAEKCEKRGVLLKIVSIMQFTLICMYVILPLVELFTNSNSYANEKPFPYKMKFPYDASNNGAAIYIITYFTTSLAGFCVVVTLFAEDSLFCYFLSYSCGQFKILHHNMRAHAIMQESITPVRKGKKSKVKDSDAAECLKSIIEKHSMIISFCDDLEKFFSPILLINFLISSFLICLVGFQIVVVRMSIFNFAKLFIYIISAMSQLFILCLNGDHLIEDSLKTATEVYNCDWNKKSFYNGKIQIVKDLQFVIARSQKPVKITALKFSILSLQSFTKILSTSLSYFTLLKTLVEDPENSF